MGYVGLQINLLPLPIRDPRMRGGERGGGGEISGFRGFSKTGKKKALTQKNFAWQESKGFSQKLFTLFHIKNI